MMKEDRLWFLPSFMAPSVHRWGGVRWAHVQNGCFFLPRGRGSAAHLARGIRGTWHWEGHRGWPAQPLLLWCWFQLWRCSLLTLQGCAWPTSFPFLPFTLPRGKKVDQKVKVLVSQSCPTSCHPMDCSLPGSSVRGIPQARILEWVAVPFSKRSSQSRDWTQVSCIAGRVFTFWATRDVNYLS